jgi:hypothetical protein
MFGWNNLLVASVYISKDIAGLCACTDSGTADRAGGSCLVTLRFVEGNGNEDVMQNLARRDGHVVCAFTAQAGCAAPDAIRLSDGGSMRGNSGGD